MGDAVKKAAMLSGLAIALDSTLALAQAPARPHKLELTLPQCAALPFDGVQLNELVEVELRAVGIEKLDPTRAAGASEFGATALVAVGVHDCKADAGEIELRLVEPSSGAAAKRTMPIADIATELRPRAIAIGIVEMVNASWGEIAPRKAQPPAIGAPASSAQAKALEPVHEPPPADTGTGSLADARPAEGVRAGISAALGAWSFPSRDTAVLGPRAAFSLDSGLFHGSLGGHAAFGEVVTASGSVDVRWVSGYIGAGLRSSGAFRCCSSRDYSSAMTGRAATAVHPKSMDRPRAA